MYHDIGQHIQLGGLRINDNHLGAALVGLKHQAGSGVNHPRRTHHQHHIAGIHRLLGTSRAESLVATGNIFLSQGESPLLIRPFLAGMTRSELFAVMTCGMASVAGSVLGGYAGLGVDLKYLIAASFMAAPGGLLLAKLLVPEQQQVREQAEITRRAQDQAVTLARMDESLAAIKKTLDRLMERMERRA